MNSNEEKNSIPSTKRSMGKIRAGRKRKGSNEENSKDGSKRLKRGRKGFKLDRDSGSLDIPQTKIRKRENEKVDEETNSIEKVDEFELKSDLGSELEDNPDQTKIRKREGEFEFSLEADSVKELKDNPDQTKIRKREGDFEFSLEADSVKELKDNPDQTKIRKREGEFEFKLKDDPNKTKIKKGKGEFNFKFTNKEEKEVINEEIGKENQNQNPISDGKELPFKPVMFDSSKQIVYPKKVKREEEKKVFIPKKELPFKPASFEKEETEIKKEETKIELEVSIPPKYSPVSDKISFGKPKDVINDSSKNDKITKTKSNKAPKINLSTTQRLTRPKNTNLSETKRISKTSLRLDIPKNVAKKDTKSYNYPTKNSVNKALWALVFVFVFLLLGAFGFVALKFGFLDKYKGLLPNQTRSYINKVLGLNTNIAEKNEENNKKEKKEKKKVEKIDPLKDKGWFGEALIKGIKKTKKIGIYLWEKDQSQMVFVPKGPFFYKSKIKEVDNHIKILVKGFYIDKYEVTNKQYAKFHRETGYKLPEYFTDNKFNGTLQPVIAVNYKDVDNYAKWVGKELPSEIEWQKAAAGGVFIPEWENKKLPVKTKINLYLKRLYPWGDSLPSLDKANYKESKSSKKLPLVVGKFPLGDSPYKCSDMAGNVWEWCRDSIRNRKSKKIRKICKGGSWNSPSKSLIIYYGVPAPVDTESSILGFRLVKEIDN